MKTNKNSIRLGASLGVAALIAAPSVFASPHTVIESGAGGPTAADLVDILLGGDTGINVSGENYGADLAHNLLGTVDANDTTAFPFNFLPIGGHAAIGSFTGGGGLPLTGLPFNSGVVLSTGTIDSVFAPVQTGTIAPNDSPRTSTAWLASGIASGGSAMLPGTTYDAAWLTFKFTVNEGTDAFYFQYAFASDEYAVVGDPLDQSLFDDAFAIYLTDITANTIKNIAVMPGDIPVNVSTTIDTPYYTANPFSAPGYAIEFDGIAGGVGSLPLFAVADNLVEGHQYRIDIVVADAGDQAGDTAVFIGAGTFVSNPVPEPATYVGALALGGLVAARLRRRK